MDRYDLDRKEKIWPLFSKCKLHSKSSKHFDPEVAMSTTKKDDDPKETYAFAFITCLSLFLFLLFSFCFSNSLKKRTMFKQARRPSSFRNSYCEGSLSPCCQNAVARLEQENRQLKQALKECRANMQRCEKEYQQAQRKLKGLYIICTREADIPWTRAEFFWRTRILVPGRKRSYAARIYTAMRWARSRSFASKSKYTGCSDVRWGPLPESKRKH